jgi:hypothetical protein
MNNIHQAKEATTRQPSVKELNHAFQVVKDQINIKRHQLVTATGQDRENLEIEIKTMLTSIGLDASLLEIEQPAGDTSGVGAKLAVALEGLNNAAAAQIKLDVTPAAVKEAKPSLWARFKAWVAGNKKKAIAGALTVFAGAAGLWFWLRGKNISTAVSSVSGMTDATVESTPVDAGTASIFTRIGHWLVEATATAKGWLVSAWNWAKGLFNRNTTATEVTVESAPEAAPAGA